MSDAQPAYKIPRSVLVVIHTPALEVLLIERADKPGYWQSVTGSKDALEESWRDTAVREVAEDKVITISCLERNDGTIVKEVDAALDCPAGSHGVLVGGATRFSCVRADVPPDGVPVAPSTATSAVRKTAEVSAQATAARAPTGPCPPSAWTAA